MFHNVLVGVDGRSTGRDAIALAGRLVDRGGVVTLAHVHAHDVEQAERSHERLEAERATAGVDARLVSVASASPGQGLHVQAERQHADLLVVGSCSRGMLGRVALGDDTRAALNGAPCAVAIAPHGYAAHQPPIAKVGVAFNGSPESHAALAAARRLAAAHDARILALHVVSLPITYAGYAGPTAVGEAIAAMLEAAERELSELPDVQGRAVRGVAGEELAIFGDEVDILVAGSRGYGPVRRLVLGSTTDYLQRHARCALLVLSRAGDASA
ncbi:MAG TPA: universal stress protein [Solirubrobacteraceae bacterium]|nr:universal stress protein [Solirubrobacteraceae bacterium]